jgi:hypothetical protein
MAKQQNKPNNNSAPAPAVDPANWTGLIHRIVTNPVAFLITFLTTFIIYLLLRLNGFDPVAFAIQKYFGEKGLAGKPGNSIPTVPITPTKDVPDLPEGGNPSFQLLKDISIFDLRGWNPITEQEKKAGRTSPVNYINYLHLIKTDPNAKVYRAHYSTSGYAIDIRCISHRTMEILKSENSRDHPGELRYAVDIDVSEVDLNTEFLLVIEATYWNGFSNQKQDTASTYTDKDITKLGELALIVLFPEGKPFKQADRLVRESNSDFFVPYVKKDSFYPDPNRKFIYWSVLTRSPDHHYQLKWDW